MTDHSSFDDALYHACNVELMAVLCIVSLVSLTGSNFIHSDSTKLAWMACAW